MNKSAYLIPAVVVAAVGVLSSIFVVDEREQALVLQFGQIKQEITEPGLAFKLPLIQEVVRYDARILSLDTETIQVTPSDDRRLDVDAFARYRIENVVQFRESVGAGGIRAAEDRLGRILTSQIREVLGADQVTSGTILSEDRRDLMNRIRDQSAQEASLLGLDIVDVRLVTTNLPEENLDETFARMESERLQEAADEIARGQEAARGIRALADRTATETLSAARREQQITFGEAEAQANATFNAAFGSDPEFFRFYRSMQAYQQALQGENSTLVLTPDSAFFDYLYNPGAGDGLGTLNATDLEDIMEDAVGEMEVQDSGIEPQDADDLNVTAPEDEAPAEEVVE